MLNSSFQPLGKEVGHFIPITGMLMFGGCRGFLVGACAFNLRAEVCETTDLLKNFALLYPLLNLQVDTQIIWVYVDLQYRTREALGRAGRTLLKWIIVICKHHLAFQVFT